MIIKVYNLPKVYDKELVEKYVDATFDNAIKITAELISSMEEINLTENQVKICYDLKGKTGEQLFDDILQKNAITQ